MDEVFRALADPSRRAMVERLARGPVTAGEFDAMLPIARPGVSRHLRVLREAGLVDVRQDAQRRIYSLRPEPLATVEGTRAALPGPRGGIELLGPPGP